MQSRRRVAITGIGAITPIGITVGGLWDGLRRERSAIRNITRQHCERWLTVSAGAGRRP